MKNRIGVKFRRGRSKTFPKKINGDSRNSAIKQVASGRYQLTT
jgi:glutamate synthase domain-containing protein 2